MVYLMNYSSGRKGLKNKMIVVCFGSYFLHLIQDYRKKRQTHKRIGWLQVEMEQNRKTPEMTDLAMFKKINLNDSVNLQEKLCKGMTFKRVVKILQWINVPKGKYQIKDIMPRKAFQWIKYFRAKVIFKKSFLPTILVKLNVPSTNWRQQFWCQEGKDM